MNKLESDLIVKFTKLDYTRKWVVRQIAKNLLNWTPIKSLEAMHDDVSNEIGKTLQYFKIKNQNENSRNAK
jgi:hypothetical protein